MQRYKVHASAPYQYLGGVENYDVIYFPESGRLILKYASHDGAFFRWDESNQRWVDHNHQINTAPNKHTETIFAMKMCFATVRDIPNNQGETK
jgi:hypothetical protein